ncbi:proteasome subunit (alpha type 6 homologue), putative [Theileria annulata]|uniref:Proteasome subunit alpha type n=1 Tax=Theileria annulata TaxID=5874 RepID=Q4U9U5_THEAN|nr:proteasome subunit (alpha type 6 homologue), putative [Theileria annulata]CAI76408.1 proteasome subunit (alpha type 6 homologue), putative [Theileria annulata]|eukprot:XP_953033.1 proteasome subunit (alpha type 6 homologue), putative [Theileria annulata]
MSRASHSGYDRHITIFSPEGKLFQLEYALKAVKNCNLTGLAIKDDSAIAVVAQKKLPAQQGNQDVLLDTSSVTSLYHITDEIFALLVGLPGDCLSILYKARQVALDYSYKYGINIPASVLCQKISDLNQVYTQHAYMRLHACTGLILSIEPDVGPKIYKFDSSGWFAGYKACGIGAKEQESENALEKTLKRREAMSLQDAMKSNLHVNTEVHQLSQGQETKVTIEALRCMIDIDAFTKGLGASSIEVAVASKDNPFFRQLSEEEIETYLTHITESD